MLGAGFGPPRCIPTKATLLRSRACSSLQLRQMMMMMMMMIVSAVVDRPGLHFRHKEGAPQMRRSLLNRAQRPAQLAF